MDWGSGIEEPFWFGGSVRNDIGEALILVGDSAGNKEVVVELCVGLALWVIDLRANSLQ